jgi:hypothetical protein
MSCPFQYETPRLHLFLMGSDVVTTECLVLGVVVMDLRYQKDSECPELFLIFIHFYFSL